MLEHASLFALAKQCLDCADVQQKLTLGDDVAKAFADGILTTPEAPLAQPIGFVGRPPLPRLVAPRDLPRRSLATPEGLAALVHAVAHIEFNAVNLAWDAVYRFRGMPMQYYRDWVGVAVDEARHFRLLSARLVELGYAYGDFDAHNGLWEMAVKTADSCLQRMALVPRVLEARGLDVTPGMIARLRSHGDLRTVEILELILSEEVAHVAAGSRWFAWCCERENCDADTTFAALIATHARNSVKGPFNLPARIAAGFSPAELARMTAGAA